MYYTILKQVVKFYLPFYFKRIQVNRYDIIPDNTPVLITCNHNSAFADALVIGSFISSLEMHFITRGDVFNPKMLWFFRMTNMVPIFRFRDGYENMKKNNSTMEYCYKALANNERIIIFSEGDCLMEKRLRPVQKGTARMAFGAYEQYGVEKLLIIPCGINYIEPSDMRSSVLLSLGEPLYLRDYLPTYNENPNLAIKELTSDIEKNLSHHVFHIADKAQEHWAQAGLEILDNEAPITLSSFSISGELYARMRSWIQLFNLEASRPNSPWMDKLKKSITLLKEAKVKTNRPFLSPSFFLHILLFIIMLPIGFPIKLFFDLPVWLSRIVTKSFKPKREFYASIRIAILWAFILIILFLTAFLIGLLGEWKYAIIFLLTSPLLAWIGIKWWESKNLIIQKIRLSHIDDEAEENLEETLKELGLTYDSKPAP